jgi:copper oxidase (laccase) domain-containing protein
VTLVDGLPLINLPVPGSAQLWLTTREGGMSTGPYASLNLGTHVGDEIAAVEHNRARVARAVGVPAITYLNQVHGAHLVEPDATSRDGDLLRVTPGTAGAIMAADCIPFAVVGRSDEVVLAHAGWRGLAADVASVAIAAVDEVQAVVIGPCIAPDDYQVGAEVLDAHRDFTLFARPDDARFRLDLRGVLEHQLRAVGVPDDRMSYVDASTGRGMFFSDRASRPCGRFAMVAVVPSRLSGEVS